MRSHRYVVAALAAVLIPSAASFAFAQSPTSPKPVPPITAGWQDGFFIQSTNGDFRLQIGLLAHADARFALDDTNETVTDTFLVRRVRPNLRGRIGRHFEFYLNPDFAGNNLAVQDAYLDLIFSPAFRIRAGKGKTPFGMERLHSASNLLFFERALPNALVPNRDVGIQALGDISGGLVSYLGGVMNGVADGASGDLDGSDSKDVSGRLIVRPFTKIATSPLKGLGLALSASHGKQTGAAALPTLRTQSIQQQFFAYSGAAADGTRTRFSPQVFYFHKAFGGWFEQVQTKTAIRKGVLAEDIDHDAWQLTGSFVLTGEAATDAGAGVRPRTNFDFGNGHWGAFQVAARYHTLKVDDLAFARDFVAPGSSRKVEAWTVGLNWYLTPNFRYIFNFERSEFDDNAAAARKPDNALLFRTQVNF